MDGYGWCGVNFLGGRAFGLENRVGIWDKHQHPGSLLCGIGRAGTRYIRYQLE